MTPPPGQRQAVHEPAGARGVGGPPQLGRGGAAVCDQSPGRAPLAAHQDGVLPEGHAVRRGLRHLHPEVRETPALNRSIARFA